MTTFLVHCKINNDSFHFWFNALSNVRVYMCGGESPFHEIFLHCISRMFFFFRTAYTFFARIRRAYRNSWIVPLFWLLIINFTSMKIETEAYYDYWNPHIFLSLYILISVSILCLSTRSTFMHLNQLYPFANPVAIKAMHPLLMM